MPDKPWVFQALLSFLKFLLSCSHISDSLRQNSRYHPYLLIDRPLNTLRSDDPAACWFQELSATPVFGQWLYPVLLWYFRSLFLTLPASSYTPAVLCKERSLPSLIPSKEKKRVAPFSFHRCSYCSFICDKSCAHTGRSQICLY